MPGDVNFSALERAAFDAILAEQALALEALQLEVSRRFRDRLQGVVDAAARDRGWNPADVVCDIPARRWQQLPKPPVGA